MSSLRIWLTCCVALLGCLPGLQAQSNPLAPTLPTSSQLSRYQLVRQWWGTAMINAQRDKVTFLSLDDTQLYVQTSSGGVTCFDAETGRRIWSNRVGTTDAPQYRAIVSGDLLLVISGGSIFAVNRLTGDDVWQLSLPAAPGASPVTDEEAIYVSMIDGSLMRFDLKTITDSNEKGLLPRWSYKAISWKYSTSKPMAVPAVINAPFVSFASETGTLYTVDRRQRTLKYTFDASEPVSADLLAANGRLYLPSADSRIYCLDHVSGQILWQYVVGAKVRLAPRMLENDLFVSPDRSGLFCLTGDQGDLRWQNSQAEVFVAGSPKTVFASDKMNNLVAIDRADGHTKYILPFDRFSVRLANELTDRIYMSTASGIVICLRERDRTQAKFYKYPDQQPVLPEFAPEAPAGESETPTETPAVTEPETNAN